MSKMSELSAMIDNLISCGETLAETGRALKEFYSGTEEAAPAKPEKKTKKQDPTPAEAPARNRIPLLRKNLQKSSIPRKKSEGSWQRKQTKQKAASRQMSKRSFRSTATEAALPMWIRRTTRHLSERWKD